MMTVIDVRPQVRLSLARTFALCLKGIRHRLFRSALTTLVIVLGVAFFMVLLGDSVIARSVGTGIHDEIRQTRAAAMAVDMWTGNPSPATLASRLTAAPTNEGPAGTLATYAAFTGWPTLRIAALASACRREAAVVAWLDALDAGTRALLLGTDQTNDLLGVLARQEVWRSFTVALASHRAVHLPLTADEVLAAATSAPATAAELEAFAAAWRTAVADLGSDLRRTLGAADQPAMLTGIAEADQATLGSVAAALERHGLGQLYPLAVLHGLQAALHLDRQRDAVVRELRSDEGRARWLKTFRRRMPLDEQLILLTDPQAVEALSGRFAAADLVAIAKAADHERDLQRKEQRLSGTVADDGLLTPRQGFLVLISLLVCMVGIANAMLMAITERFREIATMKCLGATDGYILTQFLMEAGIQGLGGGALGMLIGLLVALAKGGWQFGLHLLWYFPTGGVLIAGLACMAIGLLLATLASIYPSWMASRMAPMEAMRIE